MTDAEIRAELMRFADRIFYECHSVEDYRILDAELRAFEKKHNVTYEQLSEFVESGAGEELYMIISGKYD